MSPRELLATHTSRDLTEWQAYFNVRAVEASQRNAGPVSTSNRTRTVETGPDGLRNLERAFGVEGA